MFSTNIIKCNKSTKKKTFSPNIIHIYEMKLKYFNIRTHYKKKSVILCAQHTRCADRNSNHRQWQIIYDS